MDPTPPAVRASRHLAVRIPRPFGEVYAFVADPANLPRWAAGLGGSIEQVDGVWVAPDSPMGRVSVVFVARNPHGVVDHDVTLPDGTTVHNPMRVLRDGDGAEVVFTLRRRDGTSDAEFARDAGMVAEDLARLRRVLEDVVEG